MSGGPVSGGAPWELRGYEAVVGLEVHCELATATKLFCGCRNAFGDEANTNVCPVCLGLPGSLPVLNRHAVELAMALGLALGCEVRPSLFHRKNYFYPDMPKDYQVSQYDEPLNVGGAMALAGFDPVRIARAHLEEDTGKTTHAGTSGRIHGAEAALVDYNRAGVPLLEIVSEPDIASPAQARAYVNELRAILVATGASDARMEEGSLRVDANVSVRPAGSPPDLLGTRAEVKNLNSVRSLGRAIDHEATRQVAIVEAGGRVVQETRHWNESAGHTVSLRSKEEAFDYRYFPEPDLVPLAPGASWVERVAASLPVLPARRRSDLASATGLSVEDCAEAVAAGVDDLVLAAVGAGVPARLAMSRAVNEVAGRDAERIDPTAFVEAVSMESAGELTATQAKAVLAALASGRRDPRQVARSLGFEALGDDRLAAEVDAAVAANPDEWKRYTEGEDRLAGFFVGKVMAATAGKADGRAVTELLRGRRAASG